MNTINQSESVEYIPKQTLRVFVQALLSEKVKANKEEAQRVTGVDKCVFYWALKKHPEFRQWYNNECRLALLAVRRTIDLDVVKESGKGNTNAMKLYYQLIGELKDGDDQGSGVNSEVTYIFQSIKPTFTVDENNPALYAGKSSQGTVKRLPL